jgi:3-oxoacyl-(acyl-carrier-protein) synthase
MPSPSSSLSEDREPGQRPPRVVVTGVGVLSGNASGLEEFKETLVAGQSALGLLRYGPAKDWPFAVGAQIDPQILQERMEAMGGSLDRALALYPVEEALVTSGLSSAQRVRCAVVVGCVLYDGRNQIAEVIGETCGFGPQRYVVDAACSSGAHAIAIAWNLIRHRKAPLALAASYNTMLLKDVAGLFKLGILTRDPVRPFDARRTGTQPAEGSGALILEDFDHAQARRAPIFAEIAGVGLGSDAHRIVPPDPMGRGLGIAITRALRAADLKASAVDYINAHGTGTRLNDPSETAAIHAGLGEDAWRVPVSSTKPITGHTLGAAGMVEAIATLLATRHDFIPPTLNHEFPDPRCDLDYVAGGTRFQTVDVALSNSSGFGGLYSCIAFRKCAAGWETSGPGA